MGLLDLQRQGTDQKVNCSAPASRAVAGGDVGRIDALRQFSYVPMQKTTCPAARSFSAGDFEFVLHESDEVGRLERLGLRLLCRLG
jgi:hypothetical protein